MGGKLPSPWDEEGEDVEMASRSYTTVLAVMRRDTNSQGSHRFSFLFFLTRSET